MDKKLLGKRINTARKDRGWTSERLSEACNINATYLRQIESGAKTPSLQVFVTLCSTLNVSPDIFACGQPAPDRIAGFGFPACSLPLGHTKTDEHDRRNGPQRT